LSGVQLVEQGLGLLQIARIEAFGKPAVDRSEKIACLIAFALIAPQPRPLLTAGIASAQSPKPTDPQIAHIAYTAGQLDIAAAQLALQKSKNKDVVAFATDMERDKAVNEQALALVKKLNVTPEDNDTSKALTKQAADKRAELAKLSGAAFDKLNGCGQRDHCGAVWYVPA